MRQAGRTNSHSHFLQIAAALEANDRLIALDVNGNNIGAEGMLALANALKGKDQLQRLEISYNPIEATGAKALIDIIKFDMKVHLSRIQEKAKQRQVNGSCLTISLLRFDRLTHFAVAWLCLLHQIAFGM